MILLMILTQCAFSKAEYKRNKILIILFLFWRHKIQEISLFIHLHPKPNRVTDYWGLIISQVVHWTQCLQGEQTHCRESEWSICKSVAIFWLLIRKSLNFLVQNMYILLDNIVLKTHKSCRFKLRLWAFAACWPSDFQTITALSNVAVFCCR